MAAVIPHEYAQIDIGSVKPHPENPRIGDTSQITESIESTGFFGAIVVHKPTRRILVGNHRWEAAKRSKIKKLPALLIDCDDDTARRILVADNQYAALATWDEDALIALLSDLAASPAQLGGTGFTDDDLANLIAQSSPDMPKGFEELTPRDPDDQGPHLVTCPECGTEFEP
ncbi:MAG: ParB/RepB/Spo0J family partition protein [Streptosporangiales bacterium]|nr:ParB/RepB/Spo0J family partition protein [Streptosporangiales bacterium]